MSNDANSRQIIHVSSRAGYVDPGEISETPAYFYSIDPEESATIIKNRRTALFALDLNTHINYAQAPIIKGLIAKNAYDVHMHYLYPNRTYNRAKDNFDSLTDRFYQILKQLASIQGGLGRTIDLFTTLSSMQFILKSLVRIPEQFFDRLFIIEDMTVNNADQRLMYAAKLKNMANLSKDERSKRHFTSIKWANPNRFIAIEPKSEEINLSSKRTLRQTLIVSDCKNFLDGNEFSQVQEWKKEFPKEECFKFLAGKQVAILVHGMANTAEEAYESYDKLSPQILKNYDYILYYIWPAGGFPPTAFFTARNNAENAKLKNQYAEMFKNLKKNPLGKTDIIAHSMGNYFTLQTLSLFKAQSEKMINNFFMIAPAVRNDCFEKEKKLFYKQSDLIKNIFVLWTSKDEAMTPYYWGSGLKSGLGTGVNNRCKIPTHLMAIELSKIVPGHGLTKFEKAYSLIDRLVSYKKRKPSATMSELQNVVDEFLREKGILTQDKLVISRENSVCINNNSPLVHSPRVFGRNNISPLVDSAGILNKNNKSPLVNSAGLLYRNNKSPLVDSPGVLGCKIH